MNQKLSPILIPVLLVLLVGAGGATAQSMTPEALDAPVGTAFTYQGRLEDSGSPANGSYDFEFKLFDDLSAGSQVGSTLEVDDQAVTQGYFTVMLDFGASAFNGQARWLEIAGRPGESRVYSTLLSPRQALTASPYALALPASGRSPTLPAPT